MPRHSRTLNSWSHRLAVAWAGRRDGKLGIPAVDSETPSAYESQLVGQAQQVLNGMRTVRAERGARLVAAQDEAMENARRVVGQFKAKYEEYDARKQALQRGVVEQLGFRAYLTLMAFLAVSELALNMQAFQVFDKPFLLTLLMAGVVGLGLPLCAHAIGLFVKQWPPPAWRTALYVALAFGFAVFCLYGVTVARAVYLADGQTPSPQDDALQDAFFYINLFVFVVAILASYFAHDEDPDFANMRIAFFTLDARCRAARSKLTGIVKELETIQQTHDAQVAQLNGIVHELVYLYRRHNQRQRKDSPPSFARTPVFDKGEDERLRIVSKAEVDAVFADWSAVDLTGTRAAAAVSGGGA